MNYIEILLGGQLRGLKFNQLALEEFIKRLPTAENNQFDWLQSNALTAYACVYAGLVGNAIVKGDIVDYTFEQVSEWVDEAETEDIKKAYEMFAETQHYKNLLEKFSDRLRSMDGDPDEKKKQKAKKK